jgi:hypothetical protein
VPVIWAIANGYGIPPQYLPQVFIATFIGTIAFGVPMAIMKGSSFMFQMARYVFRACFWLLNGFALWLVWGSLDILHLSPNVAGMMVVATFLVFYLVVSWLGNRLNLSFLRNIRNNGTHSNP